MKRPLRTALADALHLRERKEHGDGRRYRYRQPATGRGTGARPARCGMEPCGLDPLWTEEYGGGRADRRRIDYRTPTGDDPCPGTGAAASDGPGEDTLFLFLKSLHQFLTAPQDAATAAAAPPGPSAAAGTTTAAKRPDHGAAPPERPAGPGRTGRAPYDGTT